jgi:hypothetical protein
MFLDILRDGYGLEIEWPTANLEGRKPADYRLAHQAIEHIAEARQ